MKKKNKLVHLDTPFVEKFDKTQPLQEYPRPNLRRSSYCNLNGEWDFCISKSSSLPKEYEGKIVVPYPLESKLSGVQRELKSNEYLYYRLNFYVQKEFRKDI